MLFASITSVILCMDASWYMNASCLLCFDNFMLTIIIASIVSLAP